MSAVAAPYVKPSFPFHGRDGITDLHLCASDGEAGESIVYPGPRRVTDVEAVICVELVERCLALNKRDFMFKQGGAYFRGHRDDRTIGGLWFRLKLLPMSPPNLDILPSMLPQSVSATLMSDRIKRGGLILITGAPGAGKTTTASAVVVSRLTKFGGLAYTLEDPPEIPLDGWHGSGVCHQGQVLDSEHDSGWSDGFRGILRSQPAGSTPMLLVGELREGAAVRASVRAAQNGFLVIATGFGTTLPESVRSLATLGADGGDASTVAFYESLASTLKIVVYQRLFSGMVSASILAIDDKSTASGYVRTGRVEALESEVSYQLNQSTLADKAIDLLSLGR